jgi:hypothetical protein
MDTRPAVINEMKACARRKGISAEDAFRDYDVKGTGTVTYANFRRVLSNLNFWSDEPKLSSATADFIRDGLFHYCDFLSGPAAPTGRTIPDRVLIQFGLSLRACGMTVREWYSQHDPLKTGRITTSKFLRATTGDPSVTRQIAAAYRFLNADEVDYFKLGNEVDALIAQRTTPTVSTPFLPLFFQKVVDVFVRGGVDPTGSLVLVDRYKRNRITAEQFSYELGQFGVTLSPAE